MAKIGPVWLRIILKGLLTANLSLVGKGIRVFRLGRATEDTWIAAVNGYRMRLYTHNSYNVELYLEGVWEKELTTYLKRRLSDESILIDVGGNIGYYAITMSGLCHHVYCFEPVERNHQMLLENVKLNGIDNVDVEMRAVSFNEYDRINLSDGHGTHSITLSGTDEFQEIETVQLDAYLREKGISNSEHDIVVKIDTENHELEVLQSMKNLISGNRCEVIFEYSRNVSPQYARDLLSQFTNNYEFFVIEDDVQETVEVDHLLNLFDSNSERLHVNVLAKPKHAPV